MIKKLKKRKKLYTLNPDDTVTLQLPGGGGFGDPAKRNAEARASDVENGYVIRS